MPLTSAEAVKKFLACQYIDRRAYCEWWGYGNLRSSNQGALKAHALLRGVGACFPGKSLKFRSSEIAGNAFISTYSWESLAFLLKETKVKTYLGIWYVVQRCKAKAY